MFAQSNRLRVVLVETSNPLNIGAAARAMSNFGFLQLRVVNPYDVAFREARSAVGGGAAPRRRARNTRAWQKPSRTARWSSEPPRWPSRAASSLCDDWSTARD